MFSYLEDDTGDVLSPFGHYSGPRGGVFSLLDGSAGVLDGQGGVKLAGADSEAGRKEKPAEGGGDGEPKSLLSATSEQLEKIIAGTGEALDKGVAGAKDALTRTWDELTGNEELHKGVEFGVKAAGEVSRDVARTVTEDLAYGLWDTAGAEAAGRFGLGGAAKVLGNPAITVPLNKAIGIKRTVDGVWGGGFETDARDLGKRIDSVYEGIYGRKR